MASKSGKNVTVEVKTSGKQRAASRSKSRGRSKEVKVTVNSQPRRKRGRGRPNGRSSQRVASIVKQQLDKVGATGPKPAISQKATSTLGTINSNTTGQVETELTSFMNPCLVKESTASNAFGPVQASAAQYGLWRCKYAIVKLTPMVGSSAISGTAVRVSLNTSGIPSSTGWSGLGARKHKDIFIGRGGTFKVTARDCAGPRESWFVTNTNESGGETVGPTIEIHSLGKTMSTYQNTAYNGPLFLVELTAVWDFANYSANPGLATLEKGEDDNATIKFEGGTGQPLTMVVASTSAFARTVMMRSAEPVTYGRATPEGSTSDTIWQICSTAVDATSVIVPPPFNWLIKGGWWFIKKIAGRTYNGELRLACYASYEDAQNNRPAICNGEVTPKASVHNIKYVQMNTPSTGVVPATASVFVGHEPTPEPGATLYLTSGLVAKTGNNSTTPSLPGYITPPTSQQFLLAVKTPTGEVDEVNFVYQLKTPHFWYDNSGPVLKPTGLSGWQFGTKSSTAFTSQGEVWGFNQQVVVYNKPTASWRYVVTNYVVVPKTTIAYKSAKITLFQLDANDAVQNYMVKQADKTYTRDVSLGQNIWYVVTAVHKLANTQKPFYAAINTTNLASPTPIDQFVATPIASHLQATNVAGEVLSTFFLRRAMPATLDETVFSDAVLEEPAYATAPASLEEVDGYTSKQLEDGRTLRFAPSTPESDTESDVDGDTDTDDSLFQTDSEIEDDDETIMNKRLLLMNTMINQGIPEDQAVRAAKRAFPTLFERLRNQHFQVGLADGLSPRQAAADAREYADACVSRGHAE